MRIFLLIALGCVFSISVLGQNERCSLTFKDSPVIRGLKLGITKQDVEKVVSPSSGIKLNNFVNHIVESQLSKINGFKELHSLDIVFMRESFESSVYRVSSLAFQYKKEVAEWDSIADFASNLSNNLNLPYDAWLMDDYKAEMKCKGFDIVIMSNYIRLESTEIKDRLKIENERKQKVFKP